MADPTLHTVLTSWMTEELKKNQLRQERMSERTNQITLLPEPAGRIRVCQKSHARNNNRNARFPCIHNKEPDDFHLAIVWP